MLGREGCRGHSMYFGDDYAMVWYYNPTRIRDMTEDCVGLSLYNADRHMGAVKEIDCPGFCLYNVTEWWCGTIPCLLYHPTMVWYHCRVGVRDGHDLATASLEHMFLMMTNNMFVSQRLSFHESSQAKDRNMTPRL